MADLSIQNAFLDGIEEVFSIMFTDQAEFFMMDDLYTGTNIYKESRKKFYLDPIKLVAKVTTTFAQGDLYVEGVKIDAVFTVPTKQLISNKIPHTTEADLDILRRGKFRYAGFDYLVKVVSPRTLVADVWQMYEFQCYVDKKSSLRGDSCCG